MWTGLGGRRWTAKSYGRKLDGIILLTGMLAMAGTLETEMARRAGERYR